ncbi:MAG: heparan-alpha-glucosaminide N-acetyltransferase domain-containing protein [Angelakisella sp.]
MPELQKKVRISFLDELRGFLIIFVMGYHLLYDLVLFGVQLDWFFSPTMNNLRNLFVAALIIISGVSSHLSHSNLKRGAKTLLLALCLTLVTAIFMPTQLILFGILHFFGCAMLLYAVLQRPLSKIPPVWGFVASVLLFCITYDVYYGVLGIAGLGLTVPLPQFLYNQPLLYPLGFSCQGLASADYYPLLPWFFLFVAGGFCGDSIKAGRFPAFFYRSHCKPLAAVGRHTMVLYLLHQPIVYGVLYLIFTYFLH